MHEEAIPELTGARCPVTEAMLIYSMSVSVDGFIAYREGAFAVGP